MRAIAERLECTAPAIYHHFADKQRPLRELVTQDIVHSARSSSGWAGWSIRSTGGVSVWRMSASASTIPSTIGSSS